MLVNNRELHLAIKWGMGFILIDNPQNTTGNIHFKRALPQDYLLIDTGIPYNMLKNINLHKNMGMMNIDIQNKVFSIHCIRKTSRDTTTLEPIIDKKKLILSTVNQAIKDKVITNSELEYSYKIISNLTKYVNKATGIPSIKILSVLMNYNLSFTVINNNKIKEIVLAHYGNGETKCVKCGQTDIRTLSIDHINGGGYQHVKELKRLGVTLYKWLIKNNYPEGYQTLCMNCQFVKRAENREYYLKLS